MKNPTNVSIDLAVNAGYIAYRTGEPSVRNERLSEDVIIDYDAQAQILGIEILALDDETLEVARAFAARHDLSFPRDLTGNLVPA